MRLMRHNLKSIGKKMDRKTKGRMLYFLYVRKNSQMEK